MKLSELKPGQKFKFVNNFYTGECLKVSCGDDAASNLYWVQLSPTDAACEELKYSNHAPFRVFQARLDLEVIPIRNISERTLVDIKNLGPGKLVKDFYGSVWYTLKDTYILVDDSTFQDDHKSDNSTYPKEGTVRKYSEYLVYGPITIVGKRND